MKKKFTLLCLALLTVLVGKAQTVYFATGFDNGMPQGVTTYDLDGRTPSIDMQKLGFEVGKGWVVAKGVDPTDTLNNVAISTSWYKTAGAANDWMVLPAVNVNSDKAVLTFRAMARDKEYRDGFKVYISDKGNEPADFTTAPVLTVSKEQSAWTQHSISLADYVGKTVYIAIVNDSKDKAALYVDDIFVGVPSAVGLETGLARVINEYGDLKLTGSVFAAGDQEVTGYTVGYAIGEQRFEQHFDGVLKVGKKTDFILDQTFHIDRNETLDYAVWVKSGADSTGVSGRVSAYPWKIVSEEVTGTWCGYCIRGIVSMAQMKETYPDSFIGIAVHSSSANWTDAMADGVEDYLNTLFSRCGISGYPHCVMNRNALYSIDPLEMYTTYNTIRNGRMNICGISLTATCDETTGNIKAETDVHFAADVQNADYKLVYVLLENDVHRTHEQLGLADNVPTGYEQNNYYAGNAYGEMGGYEKKPSVIKAEDMWYQDVARAIWPDYDGIGGIIPETVKEGDRFSHSYEMEWPENVLEKENTELVVMLLDKNGIVVNADKVEITGITSGIGSVATASKAGNNVMYNIMGQRVYKGAKGIKIVNGKKIVM